MRKTAIATTLILVGAIAVFVSDMTKQGYLELTSIQDIQKIIPNTVPPQFAKVLEGNDKDCLTKPSQTKPVTLTQIKTLRQLTDKDQVANLLGNAYCQTATGFKYFTEAGKELTVNFDKVLDYDFSTPSSQSLTNRTKERRSAEANGSTNSTMQRRLPAPSPSTEKESGKTR